MCVWAGRHSDHVLLNPRARWYPDTWGTGGVANPWSRFMPKKLAGTVAVMSAKLAMETVRLVCSVRFRVLSRLMCHTCGGGEFLIILLFDKK